MNEGRYTAGLIATAMLYGTALDRARGRRSGSHWRRVAISALLSLVIGLVVTGAPPAASAATPCLEPPVTVAQLIALEEEPGPLTKKFDPIYGVYAEHAVLCFSDLPLEIDAFLASPEGLGGTVSFTI